MQVIDVDSHITVVKGLEGTPFQIKLLPDGGHLMEFNRTQLDFTPPQGKMLRPGKPPIDMRTWWDLDRRLEDRDREGISKQVLIFHTSLTGWNPAGSLASCCLVRACICVVRRSIRWTIWNTFIGRWSPRIQ
jgi:hypothetical protein